MAGNPTLPTENIDEVILRLLALEPNEVDELDYETYKSYLKELLVEVTSSRKKIAGGEVNLLKNEFKRVRGKKGRFKIKKTKISADKLGLGGIRKQIRGTQQRLMLAPSGGVLKQTSDAVIKKGGTETSSLVKINETLDSILSTLTNINSENRNKLEKERRDAESKKRGAKEKELESRPIEGIKKVISAVTKPFQSIWDRIVNFITNIILGRIVLKLIDWIADPKNQGKIQTIIRFFKDNWPLLLTLYLRFGTGIGRFIGKLTGILVKGSLKLIQITANLAARMGLKGAGRVGKFLGGRGGRLLGAGLTVGANVAGMMGASSAIEGFAGGETKVPGFSGGGWSGGIKNFFGNMFSGMVKGPKGRDKVPAMLTDGEFVMSTGAVQKYGVDTLESMNAAGGGTNVPQISDGVTYAAGGGLVGYAGNMIKHHEALSSLKPNQNYYVSVKSPEYKKVNNDTKIYPYLDSVNVPTIGWGATYYDKISNGKKPVKMTDPPITKKAADNLLNKHLGELIPRAKSQLPLWNKMSPQQQGTIISFLYNAGPNSINPTGPYPKFSKALIGGNMREAAAQVNRSGPPASRINEEKRLLASGPLDLKKASIENPKVAAKPKEEKKPSGIFDRISSGFNSLFTPSAMAKEPQYANGKIVNSPINPIDTTKTSVKANIALSKPNSKLIRPVPRATPKPQVAGGGMGGRRGGGVNPPRQGTKPPSMSATHRRGTMTSASAYGIIR